jgi:hypothetical protein
MELNPFVCYPCRLTLYVSKTILLPQYIQGGWHKLGSWLDAHIGRYVLLPMAKNRCCASELLIGMSGCDLSLHWPLEASIVNAVRPTANSPGNAWYRPLHWHAHRFVRSGNNSVSIAVWTEAGLLSCIIVVCCWNYSPWLALIFGKVHVRPGNINHSTLSTIFWVL